MTDNPQQQEMIDSQQAEMTDNPQQQEVIDSQQAKITDNPQQQEMIDDIEEDSNEEYQEEIRITMKSVKWSSEDTKTISRYFEETVFSDARNNIGSLPSKGSIMGVLQKNNLSSLAGLDIHEQYRKVRSKLFNDRKTLRNKAEKTFKMST